MEEIIINVAKEGGIFGLALVMAYIFWVLTTKTIDTFREQLTNMNAMFDKRLINITEVHEREILHITNSFDRAIEKWDQSIGEIRNAIDEVSKKEVKKHENEYHNKDIS
jgi:methyl-accepting chemotaxis protein